MREPTSTRVGENGAHATSNGRGDLGVFLRILGDSYVILGDNLGQRNWCARCGPTFSFSSDPQVFAVLIGLLYVCGEKIDQGPRQGKEKDCIVEDNDPAREHESKSYDICPHFPT